MDQILIVEDSVAFRDALSAFLRHLGMGVNVAGSATAALIHARRRQPDAILMDLSLPDLDGVALLELLKSDAITMDIPVIVTSCCCDPDLFRKLEGKGAAAWILKGQASLKQIAEKLQFVLQERSARVLVA